MVRHPLSAHVGAIIDSIKMLRMLYWKFMPPIKRRPDIVTWILPPKQSCLTGISFLCAWTSRLRPWVAHPPMAFGETGALFRHPGCCPVQQLHCCGACPSAWSWLQPGPGPHEALICCLVSGIAHPTASKTGDMGYGLLLFITALLQGLWLHPCPVGFCMHDCHGCF